MALAMQLILYLIISPRPQDPRLPCEHPRTLLLLANDAFFLDNDQ